MLGSVSTIFLSPLWLVLALATPLLILAYLRARKRNALVVPSLFLLKNLKQHRRKQRRFKPPLSFFLELLILLLLAAAAARPFIEQEREDFTLLLDNSMSMTVQVTGSTRFENAKSALRNFINRQSTTARFSLYSTSPELTLHGKELVDATTARLLLAEIEAVPTSDRLRAHLSTLGENATKTTLIIASDKSVEGSDTRVIALNNIFNPADNLYIEKFSANRPRHRSSEVQVFASISLSGDRRTRATVRLLSAGIANNETLLQEQEVEVSPGRSTELQFSIPRAKANSISGLRLTVSGPADFSDGLRLDDEAWATLGATNEPTILLVSAGNSPLGLNTLPGLGLEHVSVSEYLQMNDNMLQQYRLVIFYRVAPSFAGVHPTLVILPPPGNGLVEVEEEIPNARLSSWREDHPLLLYARLAILDSLPVLTFRTPRWAEGIVRTEAGPVVLVGESKGVRLAIFGMEILPYEGRRNALSSILLLNSLRWLSGGRELGSVALTLRPHALDRTATWVVADPDGKLLTLDEDQSVFTPTFPGIYSLTSITGNSESTLKRKNEALAVNSFYPEESKTAKQSKLTFVEEPAQLAATTTEQANLELWRTFILLVLLILTVDIAVRWHKNRLSKDAEAA